VIAWTKLRKRIEPAESTRILALFPVVLPDVTDDIKKVTAKKKAAKKAAQVARKAAAAPKKKMASQSRKPKRLGWRWRSDAIGGKD